jgi:tyrosyl-tRNA synthetase
MSKVITDKKLIDELINRSVAEILPTKEDFRKLLLSGQKIRFYIGTDPTGTSLHLGHATNYMVLERLRQLGHEAIFLIGDFTARIGDPTDKTTARQQLSRDQVKNNVETWLKQIKPIVNLNDPDNPVKILYNHDWLAKLTFEEVINIASNFTVQQMLERDMFVKRVNDNKPIYLHEFFYPLMQGYDSVAMDVNMEICGNDQKFNALAGRTLLKRLKNKEKFVFITTLLENPVTKEKMMSKSLGTGVFLDETPVNMYGKIMSQADENIPQLFIDCTYVAMDEIDKIKKTLKQKTTNPRDIKMRLAWEITKIYHGPDLADAAQANFISTIQKKEAPTDIVSWQAKKDQYNLVDLLVETKLVESKSEARRLIEQGAIKVQEPGGDFVVIKDAKQELPIKTGLIIQRGKLHFIKITR